ncbi:MAG: ABC transporter permease [Microcystaceae cyanobacterium]
MTKTTSDFRLPTSNFIDGILSLFSKDITMILRTRQLMIALIFAPLVYMTIYGFALNPSIENVRLGVVDYAQTSASRELIATLTASRVVVPTLQTLDEKQVIRSLLTGKIKVALVIPPKFSRQLAQQQRAEVQLLIDGIDANRSSLIQGYLNQIISQYHYPHPSKTRSPILDLQTTILYNPALISSWYFVPGVLGVILTGLSTFAAASTMTAEKDYGTFEQLLLIPLGTWEILIGKLLPLLAILLVMVLMAIGFSQLVFALPFRGSILLFLLSTTIYTVLACALGFILGLLSQNLLQAFLLSFFINIPLIQLSGAYTPIEAMPPLIESLTRFDPLRYYIFILRGIFLKGGGFELLWQPLFILGIITLGLFILCFCLFHRQKYLN